MDNEILQYVAQKGQVSPGELLDNLGIPERTLFKSSGDTGRVPGEFRGHVRMALT